MHYGWYFLIQLLKDVYPNSLSSAFKKSTYSLTLYNLQSNIVSRTYLHVHISEVWNHLCIFNCYHVFKEIILVYFPVVSASGTKNADQFQ